MTDEQKPNEGAIPPRLSLKPTGESGSASAPADAKKETTRVEIPAPVPEPSATLKKKTSRIPLDQVTAETGAPAGSPVVGMGVASKTIRLAPPPPTPPSLSIPSPNSPALTTRLTPATANEMKRQTSRISLESVLGERPAGEIEVTGSTAAPKTIRIKRPVQGQAIKPVSQPAEPVAAPPPITATVATPPPAAAAKHTTTPLEVVEEAAAVDEQVTQRKTIKIRRAEGGPQGPKAVPRSMAVARIEAQMAENEVKMTSEAVHLLFPIAAAAAILILGFMVYVLFAQVFPSPSLGYPGRITL